MPEQFVETSDGIVLIANGIDAVLSWDGYSTSARQAGVTAPTATPTIAGSGAGALTGSYFAAVRYQDTDGNYSDLSPFSTTVAISAAGQIDFGNLPTPSQPDVVRRQILRNTDGQAETLYVDIDTADLGSVTLSSTRTDADLRTQQAVPLFDEAGNDIANVYGVPPNTKPFMAWHQGRMHYAGVEEYREGSVRVQLGGTIVYGSGTEWKPTMAGRQIFIDGSDGPRLVTDVFEFGRLAVDQPIFFEQPALALQYAAYCIRPSAIEENTVYISEANRPTSVPATNAIVLPQDGDKVTGIMNFDSFLYYFKRRHIYRLTARNNPLTDGRVFLAINRGCVNNRCWVVANETAYMLDEGGMYAMTTTGDGNTASSQIQDIFRQDTFADYSINWSASKYFHASHSPQEEVIRWHVAMGEDTYPRHVLGYTYTTGRWWVDGYQVPYGGSCLGRSVGYAGTTAAGKEQVYMGSRSGKITAISYQGLDGTVATKAVRGRVSASAIQTVTAEGYDLTDTIDATIAIVTGRARGQIRVIIESSGPTARIDRPWDILPEADAIFQVGGIPASFKSRMLRLVRTEAIGGRAIELTYVPTRKTYPIPQSIRLSVYDDYAYNPKTAGRGKDTLSDPTVNSPDGFGGAEINLSGTGVKQQVFDGGFEGGTDAPKMVSVGIDGVAGPERIRVQGVLLTGVVGA